VSVSHSNAFIFLGPELGKKQDSVDSIKKKHPNADVSVFYSGETSAGAIADTLQNKNLFAETRIIIIKNAEQIKKKDEIELLVSCIKNLETDTVLIILSDENKINSSLENAVPDSNKKVFYELFEQDKIDWVRSFFSREGYSIDKDGIAVILELVENNTAALRQECTRLISFINETSPQKPEEKKVKPEDIEKWLSHNREESSFTLFSRIASGDMSKALESMAVMLTSKESAQGILAGLVWCFRKLGDYLTLQRQNTGEVNSFELRKIGISSLTAKNDYLLAAKRYNIDDVEACLVLTAEYDLLLRSPVAALENILMDRYILALFKIAAARITANA